MRGAGPLRRGPRSGGAAEEDARGGCRGGQVAREPGLGSHRGGAGGGAAARGIRPGGKAGDEGDGAEDGAGGFRHRRRGRRKKAAGYGGDRPCGVAGTLPKGG